MEEEEEEKGMKVTRHQNKQKISLLNNNKLTGYHKKLYQI